MINLKVNRDRFQIQVTTMICKKWKRIKENRWGVTRMTAVALWTEASGSVREGPPQLPRTSHTSTANPS